MKILHTSDWHLGRSFHGADLLAEQAAAMDRIVEIAEAEDVELVIIAGDLYDRAIPPATAVDLFGSTLHRLAKTGAVVAAITGNHDSPTRAGGYDALLNQMGVAVRGDHRRITEPLMIPAPRDGGPPVAIYLVPFLEPAAVADHLLVTEAEANPSDAEDSARSDTDVADASPDDGEPTAPVSRRRRLTQDRVTKAAIEHIREHHAGLGPARSVVVAHTFVTGGTVSESERDLSVGHVDQVAISAFDGIDLVALGHLHRPQRLDGDRIAYSGTPLPYSFSEAGHTKSVRIVELAPDGSVEAETVPLGVGRAVRTIDGELDELLADPDHEPFTDAWIRVILRDRHLPDQAMNRLRSRFPNTVELRHQPAEAAPRNDASIIGAGELRRLDPMELVLRFWADQAGMPADEAEQDLIRAALDAGSGDLS